ncbi:MAG: site-specific DNA-methyltransferase [Acidaminococcus sp.]|jgi:site-specific DNA-methyltransferase (adenine-specific)|nr:site-specific DNA-methyltransferase [Acidaminococcus sp.]
MNEYFKTQITPYYTSENSVLLLDDTFHALQNIQDESVDMIFADPPYFLSNDGITCQGGKQVSVNKGEWDRAGTFEEKHEFNRQWIRLCKRILKRDGSIWISGTLHNIYSIGVALEQEGFKIINNITWQKTNPPPNLGCRCFTHSTETILWAQKNDKKAHHIFNYLEMKEENGGKQMKDVWTGPLTPQNEKKLGKHPTQKPLYLLNRIIRACCQKGNVVLDPFCGSSTTGVAAIQNQCKYIGIDSNEEYLELSKRRLQEVEQYERLF